MLPFAWSEDFKCTSEPQPLISGVQILFGKGFDNPTPGLVFLALLLTSVGLGFVAARTAWPWRRLAAELTAGVASLVTTLMCALMMTYGRSEQPLDHPAAWIGTLSAFAITLQAWWLSGAALRRGLDHRRARREAAARERLAERRRRDELALAEALGVRIVERSNHDEGARADVEEEQELIAEADPVKRCLRRGS
jgi:hypothetical protein